MKSFFEIFNSHRRNSIKRLRSLENDLKELNLAVLHLEQRVDGMEAVFTSIPTAILADFEMQQAQSGFDSIEPEDF